MYAFEYAERKSQSNLKKHGIDFEAGRFGVTRQSVIKVWLAERLKQITSNRVKDGL